MSQVAPRATGVLVRLCCGLLLLSTAGCCCGRKYWRDPAIPQLAAASPSAWTGLGSIASSSHSAEEVAALRQELALSREPVLALQLAEIYCQRAAEADGSASSHATDLYYQAAGYSWVAAALAPDRFDILMQARQIYHAALARMLVTARNERRFRAGVGIEIDFPEGSQCLPLTLHGFPWTVTDFQDLHPVGEYATPLTARKYTRRGWGVPVVVRRTVSTGAYREERFLFPAVTFAATIVLRPDVNRWVAGAVDGFGPAGLEAYDPLRVSSINTDGVRTPLAADLTAPFARSIVDAADPVNPLLWFLEPDEVQGEGLFFLEPYQREKIPIVFVHGLLSDPKTWVVMANDLRAVPGFDQHFQIWAFRYATGRDFLISAANLRRDLQSALRTVDPCGGDAVTRRVVLVGHSMGGLVSKLQVAASGNALWRSVANQPLERIVTDDDTRQWLEAGFFFDPIPNVSRVIFLATPHQGSSWAARPIGRFAACLVRHDSLRAGRLQRLIADNPNAISENVQGRLPTSVDMLDRNSELLKAIYRLPMDPRVRYHSVIGTGKSMCGEPADGVVPVASARLPGAESEFYVDATHTRVHRRLETIEEIVRILGEHLAEGRSTLPGTLTCPPQPSSP